MLGARTPPPYFSFFKHIFRAIRREQSLLLQVSYFGGGGSVRLNRTSGVAAASGTSPGCAGSNSNDTVDDSRIEVPGDDGADDNGDVGSTAESRRIVNHDPAATRGGGGNSGVPADASTARALVMITAPSSSSLISSPDPTPCKSKCTCESVPVLRPYNEYLGSGSMVSSSLSGCDADSAKAAAIRSSVARIASRCAMCASMSLNCRRRNMKKPDGATVVSAASGSLGSMVRGRGEMRYRNRITMPMVTPMRRYLIQSSEFDIIE
ncbi:hypothetical protein BC828DRAFT_380997 [Blastocladiella britannica]|nr:hypothetical protein BC828DRAFT_380997 [Blastocladiella britannica]